MIDSSTDPKKIFTLKKTTPLSSIIMVFGNLYVSIVDPLPGNNTLVFGDLKNASPDQTFSDYMNTIKSKPGSGYNRMYQRSLLAGDINIASYLLIGLVVGMIMYFTTDEEERNAMDFFTPVLIGIGLSALTWLYLKFPNLVMFGYRQSLATVVGQCSSDIGDTGKLQSCWNEYMKRQARLQAASMQANATMQGDLAIASALSSSR